MPDPTTIAPVIVSAGVVVAALIVNGIVGLGVESSKRTNIAGVFAAGWLTFMEGLGFIALWSLDSFAHGLALGVGFVVLGLGIVTLPIVQRELKRASAGH